MVFGLLDRDSETTPGVTAPQVSLDFGGGGGGILGGLVPNSGSGNDLAQNVLSLSLERGFAPFVDWADVRLQLTPDSAQLPELGSAGTLGITVADRTTTFACSLDSIQRDLDGSVVLGLGNGGRVLAQSRSSHVFNNSSAGDIINALSAEAGIEVEGDNGATLPRYFVDGGLSTLDHIARLASTIGRLAMFNEAGRLTLIDDSSPGEEVPISMGDAVLAAQLTDRAPSGASNITGAGASDWSWLRKNVGPIQTTVGSGSAPRETSAPWLRDTDALGNFGQARGRTYGRDATPGHMTLAAFPDTLPGSVLALSGTQSDGPWRVMRSTISISPGDGFINHVALAKADADAGALGLLGGLL